MSVYDHEQAKFVISDSNNQKDGKTIYRKIYMTVINGQTISIGLESGSEISGSLEQTLKNAVDSIVFTKVEPRPIPEAPAAAAYELPELNLILNSPQGWFVFTRDISEDDPNLKALRINGSGLADYFKANGIYLDMENAEPGAGILLTIIKPDAGRDSKDFNNMLDDDVLAAALQEIKTSGKNADITNCSVCNHKQSKFAVCDFTEEKDGKTLYGRAYFTVINGQTICLTLVSREGEISDSLADAAEKTVHSITFTKVTSNPAGEFIAVYASLAGAAFGAVVGAAVNTIRKRRSKAISAVPYRPGSLNM